VTGCSLMAASSQCIGLSRAFMESRDASHHGQPERRRLPGIAPGVPVIPIGHVEAFPLGVLRDPVRIEHGDVGDRAGAQRAAVAQRKMLRLWLET